MTQRILSRLKRPEALAFLLLSGAGCSCGTALRLATPSISVNPNPIAFGTVGLGSVIDLPVQVTNTGRAPLAIGTIKLQLPSSNAAAPDITIPMAQVLVSDCNDNPRGDTGLTQILAGDCAQFVVHYAPKITETISNTFVVITSNDPNNLTLKVPVTGKTGQVTCGGASAPIPKISVMNGTTAVNGNVLPLTNLTLSAASSTAPAGQTISKYAWTVSSVPTSSTLVPATPGGKTTTLLCSISGVYTIDLTVTTNNGCSASTQKTVNVVPGTGIHVELTWAEAYGDLDLHFIGPGGTFFDPPTDQGGGGSDLFYPYSTSELDQTVYTPRPTPSTITWGLNGTTQAPNSPMDEPSQDVDQLWGQGPENVTFNQPFIPAAGEVYTVAVHYYCSSAYDQWNAFQLGSESDLGPDPTCGSDGTRCRDYGAATATITVFNNGTQLWKGSQKITAKQVWTAATISINSSGMTVKPGTTALYRATEGCDDGI